MGNCPYGMWRNSYRGQKSNMSGEISDRPICQDIVSGVCSIKFYAVMLQYSKIHYICITRPYAVV